MMLRPAALAACVCLISPALLAPLGAQGSPLFQTDAPLQLRLEGDLRAVLRDRGEKRTEHPAVLRYRGATDGDTGSLHVKLRTRGIFRLKQCAFPPLRLDLPGKHLDGTPFAAQDKLKLVTQCRGDGSFERLLLREYALYRVFNALTDSSFRARLARVTYLDTVRADTVTRYAFLLESEAALARRLHADTVKSGTIHDLLTDPAYMTLVAMFQYLIGNTDWSVWGQHNIAIFRDSTPALLAVPYDFDFSGAVSAPYATVPPQLPIRSVRERLYRGYCQPDSVLARVLARFRTAKDSMYSAVRAVPNLDPRDVRGLLDYFEDFFRMLDNSGIVHREFVRNCRALPR
jgi:hypothetical protein